MLGTTAGVLKFELLKEVNWKSYSRRSLEKQMILFRSIHGDYTDKLILSEIPMYGMIYVFTEYGRQNRSYFSPLIQSNINL